MVIRRTRSPRRHHRRVNLAYNDNNRLADVSLDSAPLAAYLLNSLGQRVEKSVGSDTTRFHYDQNGQLIAETDGAGNVIREYLYADGYRLAMTSAGSSAPEDITVDAEDPGVTLAGNWQASTAVGGFNGVNYLFQDPVEPVAGLGAEADGIPESGTPPPPPDPDPTGLIVHLMLDETTGTIAADSSGSANNGTLLGGQSFDNDAVAGIKAGALTFDGTDDVIDLGTPTLAGSALTVAAWIKTTDTGAYQRVITPIRPVNDVRIPDPPRLEITLASYLTLVDWTGRILRDDKPGAIPKDVAPVLARSGDDPQEWLSEVLEHGRANRRAFGQIDALKALAERIGQRWLKGRGCAAFPRSLSSRGHSVEHSV